MQHELKIWPQYYCRVANGTKTFEVRENDRGFQPGDTVILREWLPKNGTYEYSPSLIFKIGYVFPIENNRVVFSLLPMSEGER